MACPGCSSVVGNNDCIGESDFTEESIHFEIGYKSGDCEIDASGTWWVTVEISSSRGGRFSSTGVVDVKISLSSPNGHISVDSDSNIREVSVSGNSTAPTKEFKISQDTVNNPPDTGQLDLDAEWRKDQTKPFSHLASESFERQLS
jgi:hypothetical protein